MLWLWVGLSATIGYAVWRGLRWLDAADNRWAEELVVEIEDFDAWEVELDSL